jgi:hypothetical protein
MLLGSLGSVGGLGTMLQAGRSLDRDPMMSIYLIHPAALDLGVYSTSNRNEYQKQKKKFWGVRPANKTDNFIAIFGPIV